MSATVHVDLLVKKEEKKKGWFQKKKQVGHFVSKNTNLPCLWITHAG